MLRCACGGFVPSGISRCPNCDALHVRPSKAMLAAAALAAQLVTACACYGLPACRTATCMTTCSTALPDGGDPTLDPTSSCFMGTVPDGGTDGG